MSGFAINVSLAMANPAFAGQNRVSDLIAKLSSSDVAQRADAAEALAKEKSPAALHALLVTLGDPVESVRNQALRAAAATLAGDRSDLSLVVKLLTDGSAARRAGAARLLGIYPSKSYVEPLLRSTHDAAANVRSAATESLGQIGDPRASATLLPLLKDSSAAVRAKAVVALGILRSPASATALTPLLRDKDRSVQANTAVALARIGDRSVTPELIKILEAKDTGGAFSTRFYAAFALGAMGDKRAVAVLIQGLSDRDKFVRSEAAQSLGQLREPAAVPALVSTLSKDQVDLVRWCAAQALGSIHDKRATGPLILALKDKNEDVREQAAKALGRLGDRAAVKPLIAALGDSDEAIPKAAVLALGRIGDASALPAVRGLLKHSDASVRQAAEDVIKELEAHR